MLGEGLKLLIEEAEVAAVITAPDEVSVARLVAKFTPRVIVVDRPDTGAANLSHFFQQQDYPVKVVVIGRNDDKIAVYSRPTVQVATLGNLIKVIGKDRRE